MLQLALFLIAWIGFGHCLLSWLIPAALSVGAWAATSTERRGLLAILALIMTFVSALGHAHSAFVTADPRVIAFAAGWVCAATLELHRVWRLTEYAPVARLQ
jgi:hypothetical protein